MKYLILLLCLVPMTSVASELTINPIIGYEKYYRFQPAPASSNTRMIYGLRAQYGVPLLSAELELTQGKSSDSTNNAGVIREYDDTRNQARFGLVSTVGLSKFVGFTLRAGARARKDKTVVTESGVSTTYESGTEIDPYAGASLTLALQSYFAVSAGATLTQVDDADGEKQYEVLYSLSASIKFGRF